MYGSHPAPSNPGITPIATAAFRLCSLRIVRIEAVAESSLPRSPSRFCASSASAPAAPSGASSACSSAPRSSPEARCIAPRCIALSASAVDQEYGFQQALLNHGLPRNYYVDLGAAYIADSLQLICAELGIRLLHTQVQDCEAKGVIERWHRTWREEVGDELP